MVSSSPTLTREGVVFGSGPPLDDFDGNKDSPLFGPGLTAGLWSELLGNDPSGRTGGL